MLKSYVYEKQGSTLLIQHQSDYKYENYSLKVDLEDKYNLDEDVALTISIEFIKDFMKIFHRIKIIKWDWLMHQENLIIYLLKIK